MSPLPRESLRFRDHACAGVADQEHPPHGCGTASVVTASSPNRSTFPGGPVCGFSWQTAVRLNGSECRRGSEIPGLGSSLAIYHEPVVPLMSTKRNRISQKLDFAKTRYCKLSKFENCKIFVRSTSDRTAFRSPSSQENRCGLVVSLPGVARVGSALPCAPVSLFAFLSLAVAYPGRPHGFPTALTREMEGKAAEASTRRRPQSVRSPRSTEKTWGRAGSPTRATL